MTQPIGVTSQSEAVPATRSVRRISSVAYATDDSASDERIASPVETPNRSRCARCEGIRRPTSRRLKPWTMDSGGTTASSIDHDRKEAVADPVPRLRGADIEDDNLDATLIRSVRVAPAVVEGDLLDRLPLARGELARAELGGQVVQRSGITDGDHRHGGEFGRDAEKKACTVGVEARHEMDGEAQRGRLQRKVLRRGTHVV